MDIEIAVCEMLDDFVPKKRVCMAGAIMVYIGSIQAGKY